MNRWVLGMIVVAVLAFGTVIGFNLFVNNKIETALANLPEPVYPVSVEKLAPTVWPQGIQAIGLLNLIKVLTSPTKYLVLSLPLTSTTGLLLKPEPFW
ncbi:hypothetical protein [Enterovibrio coralii]|uniref:hypothetical protein n=1 Tax=Enterovibrio coralii TaxID=294935 RepID=UPI000A7A4E9A|nr:hypothetical protein [Enterovibrio coralii]